MWWHSEGGVEEGCVYAKVLHDEVAGGVADVCGVPKVLVAKRKFHKFFVEAAHIECGVQGGVGSLRGEICGFELVVAGDGDFAHVLFVEDEVSVLRGEGDFAGVWGGDTCQASFACAIVWYVEQAHRSWKDQSLTQ